QQLRQLPIGQDQSNLYAGRLRLALAARTGRSLAVLESYGDCSKKGSVSLTARWGNAVRKGKELLAESERTYFLARLKAPLIFLIVLIVAFVLPRPSAEARSGREFAELGMSWPFLMAAFVAPLAWVGSPPAAFCQNKGNIRSRNRNRPNESSCCS